MVSSSASVVHHVNEATYTAVGLPSLVSSPVVVAVIAGDADRGGTVGRVTVRVVVVVVVVVVGATGFVAGTSSSVFVIVSLSFAYIHSFAFAFVRCVARTDITVQERFFVHVFVRRWHGFVRGVASRRVASGTGVSGRF